MQYSLDVPPAVLERGEVEVVWRAIPGRSGGEQGEAVHAAPSRSLFAATRREASIFAALRRFAPCAPHSLHRFFAPRPPAHLMHISTPLFNVKFTHSRGTIKAVPADTKHIQAATIEEGGGI